MEIVVFVWSAVSIRWKSTTLDFSDKKKTNILWTKGKLLSTCLLFRNNWFLARVLQENVFLARFLQENVFLARFLQEACKKYFFSQLGLSFFPILPSNSWSIYPKAGANIVWKAEITLEFNFHLGINDISTIIFMRLAVSEPDVLARMCTFGIPRKSVNTSVANNLPLICCQDAIHRNSK